mmetsp:Transcript_2167/g.14273  ORF Transcript_2167/g.14273 Transcript_2167/m.14273 type:complete len:235 (+) Transcript_2167:833-1537(+)
MHWTPSFVLPVWWHAPGPPPHLFPALHGNPAIRKKVVCTLDWSFHPVSKRLGSCCPLVSWTPFFDQQQRTVRKPRSNFLRIFEVAIAIRIAQLWRRKTSRRSDSARRTSETRCGGRRCMENCCTKRSGRRGNRGRSWPKSEKRRSKLDRCRRRSQNRRRWRTQERRTIPSSDPTTKKSEKIWPTTSSPSTSIVKSRPKCCSPQEGNPPPSCSSSLPTCCTCSQTPPITNGTTTK